MRRRRPPTRTRRSQIGLIYSSPNSSMSVPRRLRNAEHALRGARVWSIPTRAGRAAVERRDRRTIVNHSDRTYLGDESSSVALSLDMSMARMRAMWTSDSFARSAADGE